MLQVPEQTYLTNQTLNKTGSLDTVSKYGTIQSKHMTQ